MNIVKKVIVSYCVFSFFNAGPVFGMFRRMKNLTNNASNYYKGQLIPIKQIQKLPMVIKKEIDPSLKKFLNQVDKEFRLFYDHRVDKNERDQTEKILRLNRLKIKKLVQLRPNFFDCICDELFRDGYIFFDDLVVEIASISFDHAVSIIENLNKSGRFKSCTHDVVNVLKRIKKDRNSILAHTDVLAYLDNLLRTTEDLNTGKHHKIIFDL